MKDTKLRIDIFQGIIEIEGDSNLIREAYEDFKGKLLTQELLSLPDIEEKESDVNDRKTKKRSNLKQKVSSVTKNESISPSNPKIDGKIVIHDVELREFFDVYSPKNIPSKILVFISYLIEKIKIEKPNTDQIFTCFKILKEDLPKAFAQAFSDAGTAKGKKGYIEYSSSIDISITNIGYNHLNSMEEEVSKMKGNTVK